MHVCTEYTEWPDVALKISKTKGQQKPPVFLGSTGNAKCGDRLLSVYSFVDFILLVVSGFG